MAIMVLVEICQVMNPVYARAGGPVMYEVPAHMNFLAWGADKDEFRTSRRIMIVIVVIVVMHSSHASIGLLLVVLYPKRILEFLLSAFDCDSKTTLADIHGSICTSNTASERFDWTCNSARHPLGSTTSF